MSSCDVMAANVSLPRGKVRPPNKTAVQCGGGMRLWGAAAQIELGYSLGKQICCNISNVAELGDPHKKYLNNFK
jgi:hypothetical protein